MNDDSDAPQTELAVVRRTPLQWAEQLGHIKQGDPRVPQSKTHADWQHAAADKLHGWSKHAYHHQGDPFLLSQEDYEAALENAAEYPAKSAHEPAIAHIAKELA